MRTAHALVLALVLVSAPAGCGTDTGADLSPAATGGDVPTTAGALAHVAAEHAGVPDTAVAASEEDVSDTFSAGGVGAELRYGVDGEDDGDLLVVLAGTGVGPEVSDCEAEDNRHLDGCVATDEGLLMWQDELPESDPGLVGVLVDKGEVTTLVFYLGPPITGDPRELDLPIPTDALFALAQDPRVDVTTTAEAVEAGAGLPFWQGSAD